MTNDDVLLIANAFKLSIQTLHLAKHLPEEKAGGIGWAAAMVACSIEENNPDFSVIWFCDYIFGPQEKK